jgi:hypothetical protein
LYHRPQHSPTWIVWTCSFPPRDGELLRGRDLALNPHRP